MRLKSVLTDLVTVGLVAAVEFPDRQAEIPRTYLPNVRTNKVHRNAVPDEVEKLLTEAPVLDGHNDLPYVLRACLSNTIYDGRYDFMTDLSIDQQPWQTEQCNTPWVSTDFTRAKKGHLGAQLWSVYVGCETQYRDAIRQTIEQIDVAKRLTAMYPDQMAFCGTAKCVRDAWAEGKFASLIGMEGGHHIESSMAMIRIYHKLGARYMTLTHFCNTPWADYSSQDNYPNGEADYIGGLTDFGRKIVKEMNRVGMMIDISHVSAETMRDAIEASDAPVMFSHSQSRTVYDNARNAPDDVLDALKINNGVIMVNFYGGYLSAENFDGGIQSVVDHLNYIKNRIGAEHVGIGGDFDGVPNTVRGLEDVSKYPDLFTELYVNNGWTVEELKMISSGNILRVLQDVEDYANDIQQREPNNWEEAWISQQDLGIVNTLNPDYVKQCKTDFNLNPRTDADNDTPAPDRQIQPVEFENVPDDQLSKTDLEVRNLIRSGKLAEKAVDPHPQQKYFRTIEKRGPVGAGEGIVQIDGHNDLPWQFRNNLRNQIKKVDMRKNMRDPNSPEYWIPNHTDLTRADLGDLTAEFWVAYVSCTSNFKDAVRHTMEQIDVIHRFIEMYPEDLQLATTADEVQAAVDDGKIASLLCIEGGHSMDNSLELIRAYADLGVRYMTLTHNCNTGWADQNGQDSASGPNDNVIGGMTEFGKNVVLEMNRVGIFIDISHVAANTMRQALQWSRAPVIFSHSNSRSHWNVTRNAPDDVLDMLKVNGGVIMVVSLPSFVGNAQTLSHDSSGAITSMTTKELADHIDFIKARHGTVDHIGVGADFDGMGSVLGDMRDVSQFPTLFEELANRGYTEEEILKIRGKNLLRAMRGMEKTKADMAAEGAKPDETWIERQYLETKPERTLCRTDIDLHPGDPYEPEPTPVNPTADPTGAAGTTMVSLALVLMTIFV